VLNAVWRRESAVQSERGWRSLQDVRAQQQPNPRVGEQALAVCRGTVMVTHYNEARSFGSRGYLANL